MRVQVRPFPPLADVKPQTRELVGAGYLVQRELVTAREFISAARDRAVTGLSLEVLEGWDRAGALSPIAFIRGGWGSWRTTERYPTEGIEFRDETEFRPWLEYAVEEHGHSSVRPLYTPWQLLYVPVARATSVVEVPAEVLLEGPERSADWVANSTGYIELVTAPHSELHARWAATVRLLLRLQARYWPYVYGQTTMLLNPESHEYVDALDLEYRDSTAANIATQLGIDADEVEELYRWFGWHARGVDPAAHVYDLLRLQRRKDIERDRNARLQALDLYDAADMLRRFHRDLTGRLLPDVDQLERGDNVESRPFGKTPTALDEALRRHRLYPHRLHVIAEGEVEVRVVRGLFEAFTHQDWEESGLRITDLGGDKLAGSRPMIEGFGVYAQEIALLLDDENDAKRITDQFQRAGVAPSLHVTLAQPSFEEENFTHDELVSLAQAIAARQGHTLKLTGQQLREAHESRNQGQKRPKGLASVLEDLSRSPAHGPVPVKKTEIAEEIVAFLLQEIRDAPGGHEEIAAKRPIVRWVLSYPVQAYRR